MDMDEDHGTMIQVEADKLDNSGFDLKEYNKGKDKDEVVENLDDLDHRTRLALKQRETLLARHLGKIEYSLDESKEEKVLSDLNQAFVGDMKKLLSQTEDMNGEFENILQPKSYENA